MNPELVAQALEQIAEWRLKADRLEKALDDCEREVVRLLKPSTPPSPSDNPPSTTSIVIQAVVDILWHRGNRPMSVADFIEPLRERGVHLSGANPVKNLSSKLSREAKKPEGKLKSNGPRNGYEISSFGLTEIRLQQMRDSGMPEHLIHNVMTSKSPG